MTDPNKTKTQDAAKAEVKTTETAPSAVVEAATETVDLVAAAELEAAEIVSAAEKKAADILSEAEAVAEKSAAGIIADANSVVDDSAKEKAAVEKATEEKAAEEKAAVEKANKTANTAKLKSMKQAQSIAKGKMQDAILLSGELGDALGGDISNLQQNLIANHDALFDGNPPVHTVTIYGLTAQGPGGFRSALENWCAAVRRIAASDQSNVKK